MEKKKLRAQQWQEKQRKQKTVQNKQQPWREQEYLAHTYQTNVQTFLEWEAPGRPFKERSRQFFINAFFIMIIVEIILFLFSQYLLMLVVFSFVFLSFALASVPPRHFVYKITSQGILIDKTFFIWEELYDFYFFKHHGQETVHITTRSFFPGEITLTMAEDVDPEDIKMVLLHYLPFREYVEPTWMEKAGEWLERTFPLERPSR